MVALKKRVFCLLIVLFPLALEKPRVMASISEDGKANNGGSVKGPKHEMREKIQMIKKLLSEVSALAEICGACDSNPCLNGGTCVEGKAGNYSCECPIGWKGSRCEVCHEALGMEDGKITDGQISASSWETELEAWKGRLNLKKDSGEVVSWSARVKNSKQWLQIDLGKARDRNVTGIATQGGTNYKKRNRWVTKYKLQYSDDGVHFIYYKEQGQSTGTEFIGNKDVDGVVYHELKPAIRSRYIRIIPTAWRMWIAMRVELYGCQEKPCDSSPCLNGGTCKEEDGGKYSCQCATGWKGDNCEAIKACDSNPCMNGGTCSDEEGSGNFSCQCKIGWMGDNCEAASAGGIEKSTILGGKADSLAKLTDFLKPVVQSGHHWGLCWRASRDGWATSQFHGKCDNKGPTVTIISVSKGSSIFGGYTSEPWVSNPCAYKKDLKAFLFSLVNTKGREAMKLGQLGAQHSNGGIYSTYRCHSYGPTFGGGHDLHIANSANSGTSSYTNLGHSYNAPSGHSYSTSFTQAFLAGTYNFKPDEIEVFYETT